MKLKNTTRIVAAALAVALVCAPTGAMAAQSQTKEAGTDFGVGILTVFGNLLYMPVKVVYGVLGGVTGSLAYVLSGANKEVADGVWVPSLGGDYVLTPGMMTGREEVHFNGVRSGSKGGGSNGSDELGSGSTF